MTDSSRPFQGGGEVEKGKLRWRKMFGMVFSIGTVVVRVRLGKTVTRLGI